MGCWCSPCRLLTYKRRLQNMWFLSLWGLFAPRKAENSRFGQTHPLKWSKSGIFFCRNAYFCLKIIFRPCYIFYWKVWKIPYIFLTPSLCQLKGPRKVSCGVEKERELDNLQLTIKGSFTYLRWRHNQLWLRRFILGRPRWGQCQS